MKKYILILLILGITTPTIFAQEEDQKVNAFESGTLIDAQTTVIPDVKTLEFVIQHQFGSIENGKSIPSAFFWCHQHHCRALTGTS
jgi:hypothetical protein